MCVGFEVLLRRSREHVGGRWCLEMKSVLWINVGINYLYICFFIVGLRIVIVRRGKTDNVC